MKILNLYCGLGGNRKLWKGDHEITAIEDNEYIAQAYKSFFPNDRVIMQDAHNYLLNHYKEFDFIWSSPPCQSHSSFRKNICVRYRGTKPVYPDLKLYEEILFLKHHAKCDWVVENVKPYYTPLIDPTFILQRHYFWSNKIVPKKNFKADLIRTAQIPDLQRKYGFDLGKSIIKDKRQVLRNCVAPEIGLYIFKELANYEN